VTPEYMIEQILEWAQDNPHFDTSFVESLQEQLTYKELSDAQIAALENIMERWGI
jgi:hypothetical protein